MADWQAGAKWRWLAATIRGKFKYGVIILHISVLCDFIVSLSPLQVLLESPLHDVDHHVDLLDGPLRIGDAFRADEEGGHRGGEEALSLF